MAVHVGFPIVTSLVDADITASASEINTLASVTAGTVAASKALVVDSNKDLASLRDVTLRRVVQSTGGYIDTASTTATLSSNAATITEYAAVITTESLTTAAGASQALTITLSGVAAGDLAFVQWSGGGNTRVNFTLKVACTTNTVTVTVYNTEPTNALNGTIIFNLWVIKA